MTRRVVSGILTVLWMAWLVVGLPLVSLKYYTLIEKAEEAWLLEYKEIHPSGVSGTLWRERKLDYDIKRAKANNGIAMGLWGIGWLLSFLILLGYNCYYPHGDLTGLDYL